MDGIAGHHLDQPDHSAPRQGGYEALGAPLTAAAAETEKVNRTTLTRTAQVNSSKPS